MFLDKLLLVLGSIFRTLFGAAKKTWKNYEPALKDAMLHGSAIVDEINENIDQDPDLIISILNRKYPDLTKEKLHEGLKNVASTLKLDAGFLDPDIQTLIKLIQKYLEELKKLKGSFWAKLSDTIACLLAIVFAPAGTKQIKITSLMWYVYHAFIQKDKALPLQ